MTSYEALRSKAAAIDLSARGKIRVTGEDRARLLHAMSTNHIAGMQEGDGVFAFFLTAQGRIIADAIIYNLGDSFVMDTEPEVAAKLLDHLEKYIIADDVEVKDETAAWSVLGLEGPGSLECAASLGVPVPASEFGVAKWGAGFVARVASTSTGPVGVRIFIPPAEFPALLEKFRQAGVLQAPADQANVVRLENGVPRYGDDFSERYLVQETGMLHGVHANKGCYVGQEIVERVRSQAQVHRHLRTIRIAGTAAPAAGTKLTLNGANIGEVTSAVFSPALGEVVALGYVRTEGTLTETPFAVAGSDPPVAARLASSPR